MNQEDLVAQNSLFNSLILFVMKNLKLNLLEKSEMNVVRGGALPGDASGKGTWKRPVPSTCVCWFGDVVDDYKWTNPGWDHYYEDMLWTLK